MWLPDWSGHDDVCQAEQLKERQTKGHCNISMYSIYYSWNGHLPLKKNCLFHSIVLWFIVWISDNIGLFDVSIYILVLCAADAGSNVKIHTYPHFGATYTYWAKPISEWMTENNLTHLYIFYSLLLFSFSWNEYRSLRVSSSLQHIVLLRVPRCHLYISHFVTLIMFNHFFITPTLLHSEGWIILLSPHLYLVATNISDHSFTTQWHLHSSLHHQEKVIYSVIHFAKNYSY